MQYVYPSHFTCSKSNFTYLQTWQVSSGNISGNVGDTATGKCLHAVGMQCIALSNFFVFLVGFPFSRYYIIYRFLKRQFYFSYIFVKIANIRKCRKNDDYFPMPKGMVNSDWMILISAVAK